MFCYQCEQTAKSEACTVRGVCGKDEPTAALQDLVIVGLRGVSAYAHRARQLGASDKAVDLAVVKGLFTTVTNVNFDPERVAAVLRDLVDVRDRAAELYATACAGAKQDPEALADGITWAADTTTDELIQLGAAASIADRIGGRGADLTGLEELLTYGLKGTAAYADHAQVMGKTDDGVFAFFHEALDFLNGEPELGDLLGMCLRCGEVNLKVMELLDSGHTTTFGHPEPTSVRTTPVKGKAILVSGHDLPDLEALLRQTAGKGINIYTHSEMLPAHAYPELKKYDHLVANFGGAWQDQRKEFDQFPGAILFTTNCIQKPKGSYAGRLFTTGLVAWPDLQHIGEDKDFTPVIEAALAADGFTEDADEERITIGFGHNAVMAAAPAVIDAVKNGAIRHFFLIGGCDGAKPGRNYYTELAEQVPDDCVILTLACGKYRFNKLEFGEIGGIPRLLDMGQCNDAYSAIQVAVALADAFETDVNGLPLSMVLSWFEQKAVCILLTLLHLGVKDIRLGPTLPAFVTPAALQVLVDTFNIAPTATAEEDLKAILG
jgi:hydroxylamine reductase